jgi:hypothetical protein
MAQKKNVLVDKKGTMVLVTKIVVNKKLQMARYVPMDEMGGCILLVSYKDCR